MPYFEVRSLLEGAAYSDLSASGAVLIRERRLFGVRSLLEEIQNMLHVSFKHYSYFKAKHN